MARLTIDEVIEHCKRHTDKVEKHTSKEKLDLFDLYPAMKHYWEHKQVAEWLKKLKEYEHAEEDGLLIRVPHSIGTEVYFAFKLQGVKKDYIRRWQYNNKGLMFYSHGSAYSVDAIGKTVFLTKAEAEQALAKMKGE